MDNYLKPESDRVGESFRKTAPVYPIGNPGIFPIHALQGIEGIATAQSDEIIQTWFCADIPRG
jgi:hypothetical protein